jgi:nitrate reductase NapE component
MIWDDVVGFCASDDAQQPARRRTMAKFLLFCILFVLCWPIAILALVLYPLVWLLLLPFRLVGIAVGGVLELVSAIIFLPARMIRAI